MRHGCLNRRGILGLPFSNRTVLPNRYVSGHIDCPFTSLTDTGNNNRSTPTCGQSLPSIRACCKAVRPNGNHFDLVGLLAAESHGDGAYRYHLFAKREFLFVLGPMAGGGVVL
jgi:hypothetical protein